MVETEQGEIIESLQELDEGLGLDDTDQAVVETEQRETNMSTQELDEGMELYDADQVKEDHFDDKEEV